MIFHAWFSKDKFIIYTHAQKPYNSNFMVLRVPFFLFMLPFQFFFKQCKKLLSSRAAPRFLSSISHTPRGREICFIVGEQFLMYLLSVQCECNAISILLLPHRSQRVLFHLTSLPKPWQTMMVQKKSEALQKFIWVCVWTWHEYLV